MIPINVYTLGAGFILFLVAYGALVHYWPTIQAKVGNLFGSKVSKELTREHDDLEAFAAAAKAKIDAVSAAKKSAIDAIKNAVSNPPPPPAA